MSASFALVADSSEPWRAGDLRIKPASEAWERADYHALRRAVFVGEQRLMEQDRDTWDFQAIPIIAVAHACGMADRVVGAVRIYEDKDGLWYGGRLCVARDYRRHAQIGQALVNEAVARAKDLGCHTFRATVQAANETWFQRLHWRSLERMELLGQPHVLMQAELERYPILPRQSGSLSREEHRHG